MPRFSSKHEKKAKAKLIKAEKVLPDSGATIKKKFEILYLEI